MLIRPDGYVAWAGDDRAQLNAALARWGAGTAAAPGLDPAGPGRRLS